MTIFKENLLRKYYLAIMKYQRQFHIYGHKFTELPSQQSLVVSLETHKKLAQG